MADFISLHEPDALSKSFARLKKPRRYAAIDIPDEALSVGGLKIGKLSELWRNWTKEARFYGAVWSWLRPEQPRTLEELEAVQAAAGLNHLQRTAFCAGLAGHCRAVMRDHPELQRWGESRLALLEYELLTLQKLPRRLSDAKTVMHTELLSAACLIGVDSSAARQNASVLVKQALRSAAQSVLHVLGKEGAPCHLNANLMVPVATGADNGPRFRPNSTAVENHYRAVDLWGGEHWERCLVVIDETADNKDSEAEHIGFWVPLIRKANSETLPGAPTAFVRMAGDVVFKDDPPPMTAFDQKMATRWRAYIADHLEERLFVSLPLIVPNGSARSAVAVVNVNADPLEKHAWCRAYHQEWLALATDAV